MRAAIAVVVMTLGCGRAMAPPPVAARGGRPGTAALVDTIDRLESDGLPPSPRTARARALLAGPPDPDSLAALEQLTMSLWLEAARGLSGGRVNPSDVDTLWGVSPPVRDLRGAFEAAARDDRLVAALTALRPAHEGYARLRDALARYRSGADGPPAPERVRQLAVNLERWRWMPPRLDAPYLVVNIPAYELRMVEADGAVMSRVILGRTDWQTPLVHSAVTHVVLAPPWRVPQEILRRELLPLIRADTGYLGGHKFLVYRDRTSRPVDPGAIDWSAPDSTLNIRLVQLPGPANPLGRVKLVFANQFAIALHDTPAPDLFRDADRALSHGCVRVESAIELAARLLRDAAGWDVDRLTALAGTWQTRWIALPRPVPVYVTYFTAWVDDDGVLQFRDDVYGWDAKLAAALGW
jgi:murein L,D-transpeptidase YcbB/YkuD